MKYIMLEGNVEFIVKAVKYPTGRIPRLLKWLDCFLNTAIEPTHDSTGWGPLAILPPLPIIGIFVDGVVFERGSTKKTLNVDEIDPRIVNGNEVVLYQSVRIKPHEI